MWWGDGTATSDTNLYRSAADTLKTDDNFTLNNSDTTGRLLTLDTKTDTGDPSGSEGAMYYNSASKQFRCYRGGSGAWTDCMGVPKPNDRRWSYVVSNAVSLSLSNLGEIYGSTFTTETANAAASSMGPYTHWSTANVAGNTGALSGQTGNYYSGNRMVYQSGMMTGFNIFSSQKARSWHGLSNQNAATMTAINPTGRYAMFNFDNTTNARGGGSGTSTNAWCATNDGTTDSTQADSGVSAIQANRYEIEFLNAGATTVFRINGNVVCTSGWINANPSTGGGTTPKEEPGSAAMQSLYTLNHLVVGGSAVAPWIDFFYMYIEQGQ